MIKIRDNFLNHEDFRTIKAIMTSTDFPWYYMDYKVDKGDNDYQFCHSFYKEFQPQSNMINLLEPIINKIGMNAIRRIKANMTMKDEEIKASNLHTDFPNGFTNSKTGILYLNTNNGKTVFEDGTEVESVENRFVSFPTIMQHYGTTHTDSKYRIVINFNWY